MTAKTSIKMHTDRNCPKCGSTNISSSPARNGGVNVIGQTSDCADCGSEWTAMYKLWMTQMHLPSETTSVERPRASKRRSK